MKAIILAAMLIAACSSQAPNESESTGVMQLDISIPGGESLSAVSYTITNGSHTYSGVSNTTNSHSFIVTNLAAGSNYTASLSGTTSDSNTACSGSSAAFNIAAKHATTVNVNLACTLLAAVDAGAVLINADASFSGCPLVYSATTPQNPLPDGAYLTFTILMFGLPTTTFTYSVYWNDTDEIYPTCSDLCQYVSVPIATNNKFVLIAHEVGVGYHEALFQIDNNQPGCPNTQIIIATCDCTGGCTPGCTN